MRKIIVFEWITLDGFYAGADGNVDWMQWGMQVVEYAKEVYTAADTVFYGKTTYLGMKKHWTTADSDEDDREIVRFMNDARKIVFSKSLEKADWENSELKREIDSSEIAEMKRQAGKNILILGSGTIVAQLAATGLIDEYRFLINPFVLGNGKTLFRNVEDQIKLIHTDTKIFDNGNVLLCYRNDSAEVR